VVSEGERLTKLIDDVLTGKIEAGKLEWHMATVSMADVITAPRRHLVAVPAEGPGAGPGRQS
jgi:hypothetical protein